jgi:hypothetical protein
MVVVYLFDHLPRLTSLCQMWEELSTTSVLIFLWLLFIQSHFFPVCCVAMMVHLSKRCSLRNALLEYGLFFINSFLTIMHCINRGLHCGILRVLPSVDPPPQDFPALLLSRKICFPWEHPHQLLRISLVYSSNLGQTKLNPVVQLHWFEVRKLYTMCCVMNNPYVSMECILLCAGDVRVK